MTAEPIKIYFFPAAFLLQQTFICPFFCLKNKPEYSVKFSEGFVF